MAAPNYFAKIIVPFFKQFLFQNQQKTITVFLFLALTLMFAMRMSLSMAIIEINSNRRPEMEDYPKKYCPGKYIASCEGQEIQTHWTELQVGLIFSAYYMGYALGHIPGAIITLSNGAKYILCTGIFGSSILNMSLPAVIMSNDYLITLLLQFLIGLFQGTKFPAIADLVVSWVPPQELAYSVRFIFSGLLVGSLLGSLGTGISIYLTHTWKIMFYVFGITGVVLTALFLVFCYNHPELHPFISDREKEHLNKLIGKLSTKGRLAATPWRRILINRSTIPLIPTQFGHDYVYFAFLTYLPKYAAEVLHFNLFEVTVYVTVAFTGLVIVVVVTSLSFRYLPCYSKKEQNIRKAIFSLSSFVPSIFFVAGTFCECNRISAAVCFTIGISLTGFCHPEIRGNVFGINKNYACLILATLNFFSGIFAAITYLLLGFIVESKSVTEWQLISLISFMILNTSSTVYIIWSAARPDSFQYFHSSEMKNAEFQYTLEHEETNLQITS